MCFYAQSGCQCASLDKINNVVLFAPVFTSEQNTLFILTIYSVFVNFTLVLTQLLLAEVRQRS